MNKFIPFAAAIGLTLSTASPVLAGGKTVTGAPTTVPSAVQVSAFNTREAVGVFYSGSISYLLYSLRAKRAAAAAAAEAEAAETSQP